MSDRQSNPEEILPKKEKVKNSNGDVKERSGTSFKYNIDSNFFLFFIIFTLFIRRILLVHLLFCSLLNNYYLKTINIFRLRPSLIVI